MFGGKMCTDQLIFAEKPSRNFKMYRHMPRKQLSFEVFFLTFGGKLSAENRWTKLAELIPWNELEDYFAAHCRSARALEHPPSHSEWHTRALIIKAHLNLTDEALVEQSKENPFG
jgi:hypothetical protein